MEGDSNLSLAIKEIKEFDFKELNLQKSSDEVELFLKTKISDSFFYKINSYILKGEFIDDRPDLKEIRKAINNLEDNYIKAEQTQQQIILLDFFYNIKTSLDIVEDLHSKVLSFVNFNHTDFYYDDFNIISELNKREEIGFEINIGIKILKYNYLLAIIDLFLTADEKRIKELLEIKQQIIPEVQNNSFADVLYHKCIFLLLKITSRLEKDNSKTFEFREQFKSKKIDEIETELKIFDEKFKDAKMYAIKKDEKRFQKKMWLAVSKKQKNENLLLSDYYCLIRHYKEDHQNGELIANLFNDFSISCNNFCANNANTDYDKRAWHIARNYLFNNKLSFDLEKKGTDIEKLKEYCICIENIQNETGVYNYFPYLKLIQHSNNLIKNYLNSFLVSTTKEKILLLKKNANEVQKIIEENLLSKCHENIDWCKENKFQVFQTDFEECLIKHDIRGISFNIFISSNFFLPINYKEVDKKLELERSKFEQLKWIFEYQESMQENLVDSIELKKDVDESRKKTVEILGIFSAIVIFAATNTSILKDIAQSGKVNLKEIIQVNLLITYCLSTFVLLIWVISRRETKFKPLHYIILSTFSIVTFIFVYIALKNSI